ncbi:MAG: hypothetical protein U0Z53_01525 [Blastocatellia bacterium]
MNRKVRIIRLIILSIFSIPVLGQAAIDYRPFNSLTEYQETIATIKDFLRYHGKQKTNIFYIAKLKQDPKKTDSKEYLYAYWPRAKSIMILGHFVPAAKNDKYNWVSRKAVINLRTDVVPTEDDIGNSSYLVDKLWVDYIITGCRKGRKIVLKKP